MSVKPLDLHEMREMLFCDSPLDDWQPRDGRGEEDEPWASFARARACVANNDSAGAIAALESVARGEFETRQRLQAWHNLRALGVQPTDAEVKEVGGVVLDVHLDAGLDTLAAFADHSARYFNHAGSAIVWETTDPEVDELIDELFEIGTVIVHQIGPWNSTRPAPPPPGEARISILTPAGLHFGQAPLRALSGDPMGGAALSVGARLMQALIKRAQAGRKDAPPSN